MNVVENGTTITLMSRLWQSVQNRPTNKIINILDVTYFSVATGECKMDSSVFSWLRKHSLVRSPNAQLWNYIKIRQFWNTIELCSYRNNENKYKVSFSLFFF